MSSKSLSKLLNRDKDQPDGEVQDQPPRRPEGRSLIREDRLGPTERLELEQREMRPGAEYEEARWEKTARESIRDIEAVVDELRGKTPKSPEERARARTTTRSEKTIPPGLRARIHEAWDGVTGIRLVYSTKRHHVCRVTRSMRGETERLIVIVGPETIRAYDSVLEAIDALPATAKTAEAATTETETVAAPEPEKDAEAVFGDVHEVLDVEGIGETLAPKLNELGIQDTRQLWLAATEDVAKELDVPAKTVSKWQAMAELMALNGVGPQYAELLVRTDVGSIQALAEADAAELAQRLQATEAELEVRIQGNLPSEKRVAKWIQAAQEHAPEGITER